VQAGADRAHSLTGFGGRLHEVVLKGRGQLNVYVASESVSAHGAPGLQVHPVRVQLGPAEMSEDAFLPDGAG